MNLTIDSTIVELLLHKCNFVLKRLDREGPGAKARSNLTSKSPPNIAIFQKTITLPAFLHNFHIKSSTYFSDPFIFNAFW